MNSKRSKNRRSGAISEHRQEAIPKSEYQKRLDNGEDGAEDYLGKTTSAKMRFWSDFNRMYYIPRSIQQVPDLPEWEACKGNWNHGKSVFERYNTVGRKMVLRAIL